MNKLIITGHICSYIKRGLSTRPLPRRPAPHDTFGNLSVTGQKALQVDLTNKYYPEDADQYDKEEFELSPRKNLYYYTSEIRQNARAGPVSLKKALDLYHEMKVIARLQPDRNCLVSLLYGCAKAGFVSKAFELYEESLKYIEGRPSKHEVDSLIHVCGRCPPSMQEYALKKLDWFLEHLRLAYNYHLDPKHYETAIEAYGRLGALGQACKMLKLMADNDIAVGITSINAILSGCLSNKSAGVTLALRVFKRMQQYHIKPNEYSYSLLARCIRDCGIGPPELLSDTIKELPATAPLDVKLKYQRAFNRNADKYTRDFAQLPNLSDLPYYIADAVKVSLEADTKSSDGLKSTELLSPTEMTTSIIRPPDFQNYATIFCDSEDPPNLLSDDPLKLYAKIQSIDMKKLDTRDGRLYLFGGLRGFIDHIMKEGLKCESRLIYLLASCTDSRVDSQLESFKIAQEYGVKLDLESYNMFISKICNDYTCADRLEKANEILKDMRINDIEPDIVTYHRLAKACNNSIDAHKYLMSMKRNDFSVTDDVLLSMMKIAYRLKNMSYVNYLLTEFIKRRVRPTKEAIERLELLRCWARDFMKKSERRLLNENEKDMLRYGLKLSDFDKFDKLYSHWIKTNNLRSGNEHPWRQFEIKNLSKRGPQEGDIISSIKPILRRRREAMEELD